MGFIATAFGNHAQEKAAKQASAQQQAAIKDQQQTNTGTVNDANATLGLGEMNAENAFDKYGNAAINTTQQYGNQAINALKDSTATAQNDLGTTGAAGLRALGQGATAQQGGYSSAIGSTVAGANAATNTLQSLRNGRAGAMLDQPGGLYGGFTADPSYQFALDQSEQAINRAAAAHGGRLSGETLKALQNNASGLATQNYQNFIGNRNSLYNNVANNDAYNANLGTNEANLQATTGTNVAGLQTGAGNSAYNAAANNANFGFGVGQAQAGAATALGTNTAQTLQQIGAQASGYQNNLGQNIGSLTANTAGAQAGNQMTGAQLNTNLTSNLVGAQGMPVQYSGQTLAGIGKGIDQTANAAAAIFGG
jgi:hypothetical protein